MKLYAVTAIDVGDTTDGHANLLDVFHTREQAMAFVEKDKANIIKKNDTEFEVVKDFEIFLDSSCLYGYIWDIHEIDTDEARGDAN